MSSPSRLKRTASSFMSAMSRSRWVFSMTLAASATRMLLALWVPAVMILAQSASMASAASGAEPLVTFLMAVSRCDHIAAFERRALGLAGTNERGEVGSVDAVHGCGHRDDEDAAVTQRGGGAGDRVALAKLDSQGQADVAEADDGDGLSDEVHVAGCEGPVYRCANLAQTQESFAWTVFKSNDVSAHCMKQRLD
jgi:hypothetical protein